jgi:hypothetical protein
VALESTRSNKPVTSLASSGTEVGKMSTSFKWLETRRNTTPLRSIPTTQSASPIATRTSTTSVARKLLSETSSKAKDTRTQSTTTTARSSSRTFLTSMESEKLTKAWQICITTKYLLFYQESKQWFQNIGKTNWLGILSDMLITATDIKQSLCKGFSVLVHCSDGWDRTSQICLLVQLLIFPAYRTLRGFCQVFEKEFVK